jgi:two-component system CheB/CheR fusion protein
LREHPDEVEHLVKDLLISVTSFFRDPEALQVLEMQVIAPMVKAKDADAPLRVWIPGCATGEEPYSIAMLLLEQLTAAQKSCNLQIFASDIGEDALEIARQGVYPESIVADVSPKRLGRFFTRVDDQSYQVTNQLREAVLFAKQNLVSDAPFSKLDLISCRNLLIYLEAEIQKKVIALLHFALNEGGYLFLGPSEAIGQQVDLFEPVSKKWRVYRRIGPSRRDRVEFPIVVRGEQRGAGKRLTDPAGARPINFAELTQQVLLEEYAPAAVLINRAYEILYFYGPTTRYLHQPTGEPTQDLIRMAPEGLRIKLRAVVHKAIRDQQQVVVSGVRVKRDGVFYPVKVTVKPVHVPKPADGLLLVILQDEHEPVPTQPSGAEVAAEEPLLRQLEYELKATREDLQSTIEEMESSNEELKVSNEEVMSMNEELQSANEELESSKEELQSLNEELITVNNQLQNKVEELEASNNNLANLLSSTDIATLCLDTGFRIKWFTPATTKLLNLIATDVGRPINDIAHQPTDRDLLHDSERVLRDLTPIEKEVRTEEGYWYLRRILPYRTLGKKIEGVVVTFADVTPLKHAAERLRRLATVLLDSNDAVTVLDFEGRITAWNRGAERMYGYSEAEALQMNVEQMVPQELRSEVHDLVERQRRGGGVDSWETRRVGKDGRLVDVWLTATALKDEAGKPTAVAKPPPRNSDGLARTCTTA